MENEKTEAASNDFQKLPSNFLKWFNSNPGTRVSPNITLTDLRSRDAGRGVVANTDISADEELFAVPRSLVLQKADSELYSRNPEFFANLGPWDSLILVIVYEYLRRESSPWFPYLQLLPSTFDTLMFWTPDELVELQGSAVINKIGRQQTEDNWSSTIIPIMRNNEALFLLPLSDANDRERRLLELAHMAGSLIMAYAFDIGGDDSDDSEEDAEDDGSSDLTEDDEDNPVKGMVPFADMLNADAHRNNARLFHEGDFLIMKATKDIKAKDEILNDYGPLPRSDLLRMYGYLTDNYSTFDVVEISADLIENVAASSGMHRPYLAQKREELERLGLIDDAFIIVRPGAGSSLNDVLPVDLRMLITSFCQPAEQFHPTKLSKLVKESGLTLAEASLLLTSITNRLRDYRSSLQEDSQILKDLQNKGSLHNSDAISYRRYEMAVQVRKGEKEILHQVLQLIQDFVAEQTRRMVGESAKRKRDENGKMTVNKKKPTRH